MSLKTVLLWVSLLVVVFLAWHFAQLQDRSPRIDFDELLADIEAGEVRFVSVRLQGNGPSMRPFGLAMKSGRCPLEKGPKRNTGRRGTENGSVALTAFHHRP